MSLIEYAFPDYDDTLPVIEGFSDYSYKNDACPCIGKEIGEHEYILVFCDYKNKNKSECHNPSDEVYYRFCVMLDLMMDENQINPKTLGLFKTKNEVKKFLKSKTIEQLKEMEDFYG